jgi:hypothetical protein
MGRAGADGEQVAAETKALKPLTPRQLNRLLGDVQEADTPEQRDRAWDRIVDSYEALRQALPTEKQTVVERVEYPGYRPQFDVEGLVEHLMGAARQYMSDRGEDHDDVVKATFSTDGFDGFEVIGNYTDAIEFKVVPRPAYRDDGRLTDGEPRLTRYPAQS